MKIELPKLLADFADFDVLNPTILIIESEYYIEPLRQKFTDMSLTFASSNVYKLKDVYKTYKSNILYTTTDFKTAPLTFAPKTFDIIIGDKLLSECYNPQDIASGLGSFLKPTGCLLTTFDNLLAAPHMEKLIKDERSDFIVLRGYTREDFERLMVASFYKEIFFYPLADEFYFIAKCYRAVEPVRNLKLYYTEKERAVLSKLLHRIEYDINVEDSLNKLNAFAAEHHIIREYLEDFIHEACYYREKTLQKIKELP